MNAHLNHAPQSKENPKKPAGQESAVCMPSQVLVRAKLEMTEPGDSDELEADAAADSIVKEGKIARAVSGGHSGGGIALPSQMGSQLSSMQGHGSQLYGNLKTQMESGFGRDFSDVRLHTGDAAAEMSESISARAFTYGNDIFFNRGQFNPGTPEGQHLIAHELTHAIQNSGKVARQGIPAGAQATVPAPAMPKATKETTADEEEALRQDLIDNSPILENKFGIKHHTIENTDSKDALTKILEVLSESDNLIQYAQKKWDWANNLNQPKKKKEKKKKQKKTEDELKREEEERKAEEAKKAALIPSIKSLVQVLFNTLTQVSVAMDILSVEKLAGNQVSDITDSKDKKPLVVGSDWDIVRTEFVRTLVDLGKLSHNPAITVLMYEGTYYRTDYNSISTTATSRAAKGQDAAALSRYGAVCNNAAHGAMMAAGQKDSLVGLSKSYSYSSDRKTWNNYSLQGSGEGDNALDSAQQGDRVVFWDKKKFVTQLVDYSKEDSDYQSLTKEIDKNNAKIAELQSGSEASQKANSSKIAEQQKKLKKNTEHREAVLKKKNEKIDFVNKNKTSSNPDSKQYVEIGGGSYIKIDDALKALDLNASHIEVIVGVREKGGKKQFLLSGAHSGSKVNGIARNDQGELYWKSASEIRTKSRIMRLIPTNDKSMISVDLSSMQAKSQTYSLSLSEEIGSKMSSRLYWTNDLSKVTIDYLHYIG